MTPTLGPVGRQEYLDFLARRPASYAQCPSWAQVKHQWSSDHLGWRDGTGALAGVALVQFRRLPGLRRSLAFVPAGPVVDWAAHPVRDLLDPLVAHVRARGAVGLRIGPELPVHRWHAATLKAATGPGVRLGDVPADGTDPGAEVLVKELAGAGWSPVPENGLYGTARHSVRVELRGRTEEDLLRAMNQQWRRGIRKAEKAGVTVEEGGRADLEDFYRVYVDTAQRDGFGPQTYEHFERAWTALSSEAPGRIRLYLGRHEGEVLAAMLVVTVGDVAGYAWGGSASHRREVQPSNAVHWRIMRDLREQGVAHYDLRGMGEWLDPDRPGFGLVRFKLGSGGDAVQLVGDWDLPVRPAQYRAVMTALRLRPAVAGVLARVRRAVRR